MADIIESPKKKQSETDLTVGKKADTSLQKYTLSDLHKDYEQQSLKIFVTSPRFDDVGKVLDSLNVAYENFIGAYDCRILFLNCGTSDDVSIPNLRKFVNNGGCLYASDWTSSIIDTAFPREFNFLGNTGTAGKMNAKVLDNELKHWIGNTLEIEFDLGGWSELKSVPRGKVILSSEPTGNPLMVTLPVGKGNIYYTCFHNHKQSNRSEQILLQLLVLKQLSTVTGTSLESVGQNLGINLPALRDEVNRNKGMKKKNE